MVKIDTINWEEFHLYDIFEISMWNKLDRGKMVDWDIAFIGRTAKENWINARVSEIVWHDKYWTVTPYPAGCLTLALWWSIGACFLQKEKFYTSQNVAVLIPKRNTSDAAMLFVASVIQNSVLNGVYWAFTEELNKHIRRDFVIRLPIVSSGNPDWQYMENFIKNIEKKSKKKLVNLKSLRGWWTKININNRNYFKIWDLFDVYTWWDMLIQKLKNWEYPLISHSAENNWIAKYIDKQEKQLFNHNYTISLADRWNFKSFVQFSDFYIWTRVKALYLKEKYHKDVSKESLLFLSSLIDRLSLLFDYRDNATSSLPKHVIPLPVDNDWEPNWKYMNDFITNRKSILKKYLSSFS